MPKITCKNCGDDIVMSYNSDGTKFYIIFDKVIFKYALSIPFAIPSEYTASYIGKIERVK